MAEDVRVALTPAVLETAVLLKHLSSMYIYAGSFEPASWYAYLVLPQVIPLIGRVSYY